MTWNVENLFNSGTPSGPSTQQAYDAKIQGLAAVIQPQAPDASLQEIGDPNALGDLVHAIGGTWHRRVSQLPTFAASPWRGSPGPRSSRPPTC